MPTRNTLTIGVFGLFLLVGRQAAGQQLSDDEKKWAARETGHQYKYSNLGYTGAKGWPQVKESPQYFCGYLEYQLTSHALGGGKWSAAKSEGVPASDPTEVADCKFPAGDKKFGAVTKQALSSFPGMGKGDVLLVMPGENWAFEKNALGQVVARTIESRLYSKKWERKQAFCGTFDKNTFCAQRDNEKGAVRAMAQLADSYNHGIYALDEARKAKKTNDFKDCRVKAFYAAMDLGGFPQYKQEHTAKNEWVPNGRFLTDEGLPFLTEAQFFERAAKGETEGRALYTACGGTDLDAKLKEK